MATTDPNGPPLGLGYLDGSTPLGKWFYQSVSDGVNTVNNVVGSGAIWTALGISPARVGKGIHQTLVSTAGVGLILLGFIMIVSGTKTARGLAGAVVSTVKEGATVAAV